VRRTDLTVTVLFVEDEAELRDVIAYELEHAGFRVVTAATGEEAGKRTFADEMSELTGASHGECDADCWCHSSPDAAASCLEERRGHAHTH